MIEADPELEDQFHRDMLGIYRRVRSELGCNATRFLQMLSAERGLVVAHRLLRPGTASDGLTTLVLAGRPDLTVEALVQQAAYRHLFSSEEIEEAEQRVGRREG